MNSLVNVQQVIESVDSGYRAEIRKYINLTAPSFRIGRYFLCGDDDSFRGIFGIKNEDITQCVMSSYMVAERGFEPLTSGL